MAPSQMNNPGISKFFSTVPLENLITLFENIFHSFSIPLQRTLVSPTFHEAQVKFRGMDSRGEMLHGAVRITEGFLPDMGMDELSGQGIRGWDVVCWKKLANPLELRRLWLRILKVVPEGVVYSM